MRHIESDSEERNNFRSDTGFLYIHTDVHKCAVWGWMKMKWICFAHTRIAVLIAYCWQQQQFHDDDYTPSHIYLKFKWEMAWMACERAYRHSLSGFDAL